MVLLLIATYCLVLASNELVTGGFDCVEMLLYCADAAGQALHVDGGARMRLDGPIVLCGRSDNDTTRGYNGLLTQLAIFDSALTPVQVYEIYQQVKL